MHRDSLRDLRLRLPWTRGPAAGAQCPLLVSYTEFTPHTLRDLPAIYRAAQVLRRDCAELEGAVGLTLYWQPVHRRGGSLSVWTDPAALRRFVALPFHLEIMRRYRTRGSLRAIDWQDDALDLRAAFARGQSMLDAGEGRRSGPAVARPA